MRLHVRTGQHRAHARQRPCRGHVDGHDARVRVGAAQERRVGHARNGQVVDVATPAGQQPRVLDPLDPGANQPAGDGFTHGQSPPGDR